MFTLVLMGMLVVGAIGFFIKWFLDFKEHKLALDNKEFAIATIFLLVIAVPLTAWVGTKVAINNQLTFHENWGGYEQRADESVTQCYRDGPCRWSYKGDPYQYVWYTDDKSCTGSGSKQTCTTTHTRHEETRYHDIPYCTEEWTFTVNTSLGQYTIADRNCPSNPNAHRYRAWVSVPEDEVSSGVPVFWTQAKARLDAGQPGPVTARHDYTNYLLASQSTILHRFSGDMESYVKSGQLPALSENPIHDFYYADRVFFEGVQPSGNWQAAINRFDAAFGSQLQGDMYLVLVNADSVKDPDNYAGALGAYWQSPKFGKDALSKNGLVVILGVKDGSVAWARASTGMPEGNETLLVDLQQGLKGAKVDPAVDSRQSVCQCFHRRVDAYPGRDRTDRLGAGQIPARPHGRREGRQVCWLRVPRARTPADFLAASRDSIRDWLPVSSGLVRGPSGLRQLAPEPWLTRHISK